MRSIKKIPFFIVILSSFNFAQTEFPEAGSVKLGALYEISTVFFNKDDAGEKKLETGIYPISIYLSGRINISRNFSLEFRPGILFGDEIYSGVEYGLFLRYRFYKSNIYLISGVNWHNNYGNAENVYSYKKISDEIFSLINFALGYSLKNGFCITLSYYYPIQEYEVYYRKFPGEIEADILTLRNIIKAGFEYTF